MANVNTLNASVRYLPDSLEDPSVRYAIVMPMEGNSNNGEFPAGRAELVSVYSQSAAALSALFDIGELTCKALADDYYRIRQCDGHVDGDNATFVDFSWYFPCECDEQYGHCECDMHWFSWRVTDTFDNLCDALREYRRVAGQLAPTIYGMLLTRDEGVHVIYLG